MKNNQINELDPGLHRGDERGNKVIMTSIEIPSGSTLEGNLPSKQMKLVQAWIALHTDELMADWALSVSGEAPYKIEPLR